MDKVTIEELKELLEDMNLIFEHSEELETCDPIEGCEKSEWINQIHNREVKDIIIRFSHDKNDESIDLFMRAFSKKLLFTISLDDSEETNEIFGIVKENIDMFDSSILDVVREKEENYDIVKLIDLFENSYNKFYLMSSLSEREGAFNERINDILEISKDNPSILTNIWGFVPENIQNEKIEYILEISKNNPEVLTKIWQYAEDDVKEQKLVRTVELLKDTPEMLAEIWKQTASIIQEQKLVEIVELLKDDSEIISVLINNTEQRTLGNVLVDLAGKKPERLALLMQNINSNLKEKIIVSDIILGKSRNNGINKTPANVLSKMSNENKKIVISNLWKNIGIENQEEKTIELIKKFALNKGIVAGIWMGTDVELQEKRLMQLMSDDTIASEQKKGIWMGTDVELQEKRLMQLIRDVITDNKEKIGIWINTDKHIQSQLLRNLINEFPELCDLFWINANEEVQKENKEALPSLIERIISRKEIDEKDSIMKIICNTNVEVVKDHVDIIAKAVLGKEEIGTDFKNKLYMLIQKNKKVLKTLNWNFLDIAISQEYTDEQILRITNYPEIQKLLLIQKDSKIMNIAIPYILKNDTNWILSLNNILNDNLNKYTSLIQNLSSNINKQDIDEQFIQNFIAVISDTNNYFDIKTADDVKNYVDIKNSVCKKILDGDRENIPEELKLYSNEDLYKFALLEYKFGISFEESKFLLERYGKDTEEILNNNPSRLEAKYLMALKLIVECDYIEDLIKDLRENNTLEKPWEGTPTARNVEGEIINMFAELYNEKLYTPREEEQADIPEMYTDNDGKKQIIDVFYLKSDFNTNIRVEGAYRQFIEPENFVEYYDNPDIDNHGNCESYIGSDLIAVARNRAGVAVGYSVIRQNQLTAAGPYDLSSSNTSFSNYAERSEYRTPEQMKNNTRHTHNEMVKDRIIIDENGYVQKYKPSYAIWVEEDTEEERNQEGWKENRELDPQWIMTKKLAAQLGIPIVVIDREYFAKREMKKIELMEKLISGEEFEKDEYKEFIDQYKDIPKAELIGKMIIKFENNRTGIQFNEKLNNKYFSQQQFIEMIKSINSSIEKSDLNGRKKMYQALLRACNKERCQVMRSEIYDQYNQIFNETNQRIKEIDESENRKESTEKTDSIESKGKNKADVLFQLFENMEITRRDIQDEQKKFIEDVKERQEDEKVQQNEER